MRFDNGAANGESKPKPLGLCGVERLEELVHLARFQADARILDHDDERAARIDLRSDAQRALWGRLHGVGAMLVPQGSKHDLLQLDTIGGNVGHAVIQFELQRDLLKFRLSPN